MNTITNISSSLHTAASSPARQQTSRSTEQPIPAPWISVPMRQRRTRTATRRRRKTATTGENPVFLLVPALIMLPIGMISWRLQKRKLYFKEIRTALSKEEIFEAVGEIGEKDEWSLEYAGEDCIVTHTNPGMWSLTWGEQIFIVFDEKRIWVNSINDLNKRTNIISFVRNKRNIRKVEEAVRNKEKTIRNI